MIKTKQFVELLYSTLDTEEEMTEHFYKYTTDSLKYYKWLSEVKRKYLKNTLSAPSKKGVVEKK